MPRLYMAWLSPAMFAEHDAELDLLADLLANGKTSRLYRTLVYEQRLALDVGAHQGSRELGSFFLLVATAAPGRSLTDIAAIIDIALQQVQDAGPSESEMERARAQVGSALHVPAPDGGRIRRQVGSAEFLQRAPRRPRLLFS